MFMYTYIYVVEPLTLVTIVIYIYNSKVILRITYKSENALPYIIHDRLISYINHSLHIYKSLIQFWITELVAIKCRVKET